MFKLYFFVILVLILNKLFQKIKLCCHFKHLSKKMENETKNNGFKIALVEIDFGKVLIYSKNVKEIDLSEYFLNISEFPSIESSSSIYNMFEIKQRENLLKIIYKPKIPNKIDVEIIDLLKSTENYYKICVKGECTGPSVQFSARYLNFSTNIKKPTSRKCFEMRNNSDSPVLFQFDMNDNKEDVFQVNPMKGKILSMKSISITVKFIPQTQGMWSRKLFCLIENHPPRFIEIFGINSSKSNLQEVNFINFSENHDIPSGFSAYFQSAPIFLDKIYFDFNRVAFNSTIIDDFQLTNDFSNDIMVQWPSGIFLSLC